MMKAGKILPLLTFLPGIMFMSATAQTNNSRSGDLAFEHADADRVESRRTAISIYPTPSHENLIIQTEQNGYLRMVDENGFLVKETPVYRGMNEIDLSDLKAQRYFLQVKTTGNTVVKRLLIQ